MALNFPPTPTNGQTYTDSTGIKWVYNAPKQRWARYAQYLTGTFVQSTAPTATAAGQFWYDTANEVLKMWSGTEWIEAGGGGGASVIVSADEPATSNEGDMWLDTSDDTLKIYGGSGWISINTWNALNGTADSVPFTITAPNGAPTKGVLAWDGAEETLSLGLAHDSVLQLGQETLYHVQNASTTTPIADGTPVMYSGTVGNSGRMYVTPWSGDVADVKKFMGLATGPIPPRLTDADTGYVTHFGKVRGIKTDGDGLGETWNNGQILYLKKGAGGLTNVAPTAPGPRTIVALVLSAHSNNGTLFVRITHGSNLGDDELVQLSGLANRDALLYNDTNDRFENRAIVSADVSDATSVATYNTIVKRDATGGFSAGSVTASGFNVKLNYTNTASYSGVGLDLYEGGATESKKVTLLTEGLDANRAISFPNASGTVSLVGHTHVSADITDATDSNVDGTVVKRGTGGSITVGQLTATGTGGSLTIGPSSFSSSSGSGSNIFFQSSPATALSYTLPNASGYFALTNRTDGVPDNIIPNNAATTRTNLGLGTTNSPEFAGLNLTGSIFFTGSRLITSSNSGNVDITGGNNYNITLNSAQINSTAYYNGFFSSSYDAGGFVYDFRRGGSSVFKISDSAATTKPAYAVQFRAQTFLGSDEANELAQRNGTNAQTFRLYRTYTSASSYQRLTLSTTTDAFNFTAESTSTSNLDLNLLPQGTGKTKTTNLDATGDITASGGAGEVDINSLYGSGLQFRSVEAVVNTNTTTATAATGTIIPAGALVLGVVVRVTTVVAGPTASFKVGIASVDDDKWGNAVPIGVNSTTTSANFTDGAPMFFSSATAVTLTANDNTFTSGAVRVCVHYLQISQLTA